MRSSRIHLLVFGLLCGGLIFCKKYNTEIITEPPGAKILQGQKNIEIGVTPFKKDLSDGKYSISITKEGLATEAADFEIKNGKTSLSQPLKYSLKPWLERRKENSHWEGKKYWIKNFGHSAPVIFQARGKISFRNFLDEASDSLATSGTWRIDSVKNLLIITEPKDGFQPGGGTLYFPLHSKEKEYYVHRINQFYTMALFR